MRLVVGEKYEKRRLPVVIFLKKRRTRDSHDCQFASREPLGGESTRARGGDFHRQERRDWKTRYCRAHP